MTEEYTPSVDEARVEYISGRVRYSVVPDIDAAGAEFDRMIAALVERTRAEEREKAAQIAESAPGTSATGYYSGDHQAGYQEAQNWIADRIRAQKRMLITHPHDGHGPTDTCFDCERGES